MARENEYRVHSRFGGTWGALAALVAIVLIAGIVYYSVGDWTGTSVREDTATAHPVPGTGRPSEPGVPGTDKR